MKRIYFILSMFCASVLTFAQNSFTSETYRDRVLNYSLELKGVKEQVRAAEFANKAAFRGYLPKLDATGEGTLNLKELDAWKGPVGQYRTYTYSGYLVLSQPLYTGGALKAQNDMTKIQKDIASFTQELTYDQICYGADAAYWSVSAYKAVYDATLEFQRIISQQLEIINTRFSDGYIGKSDLLMMTTRMKEAELQVSSARQNYIVAMQNFYILIGEDPATAPAEVENIDVLIASPKRGEISEVLTRRGDYLSAYAQTELIEAQRKAAISQYNPTVGLSVVGGWSTNNPNLGIKPTFAPILGMSVNVPILRWGQRCLTNQQFRANRLALDYNQQSVADKIKREVNSAWTNIVETTTQIDISKENIELATENLDLITFSYEEGKASIVEVLSAQLSWIQAKTSSINSFFTNKLAVSDYNRAISNEKQ